MSEQNELLLTDEDYMKLVKYIPSPSHDLRKVDQAQLAKDKQHYEPLLEGLRVKLMNLGRNYQQKAKQLREQKRLDSPELVHNPYGKPSKEEGWSIVSEVGCYVGFDEGSRAQRQADIKSKLDRPELREIEEILTEPNIGYMDWELGKFILANWKANLPSRILALIPDEEEIRKSIEDRAKDTIKGIEEMYEEDEANTIEEAKREEGKKQERLWCRLLYAVLDKHPFNRDLIHKKEIQQVIKQVLKGGKTMLKRDEWLKKDNNQHFMEQIVGIVIEEAKQQERERIMKIFASFGKIQLEKPLSGEEFEALFD